jgi:hypothetical protein
MLTNSNKPRTRSEIEADAQALAACQLRAQVPERVPVWIPAKVSLFSKIINYLKAAR